MGGFVSGQMVYSTAVIQVAVVMNLNVLIAQNVEIAPSARNAKSAKLVKLARSVRIAKIARFVRIAKSVRSAKLAKNVKSARIAKNVKNVRNVSARTANPARNAIVVVMQGKTSVILAEEITQKEILTVTLAILVIITKVEINVG